MLPHFIEQDFQRRARRTREGRLPVRRRVVRAAFRIPLPAHRRDQQRGIRLELRQALEPWHVLGEEPGGGGTARYVDSSLERLQVKVAALTGGRHVVDCNGWRLPLHPTGRRASSSPACASAPGSRRPACIRPSACMRRWCSTWSMAGTDARWRLHLPRLPSRRPQLRNLPGQRQRGGGPPRCASPPSATARGLRLKVGEREPRLSLTHSTCGSYG